MTEDRSNSKAVQRVTSAVAEGLAAVSGAYAATSQSLSQFNERAAAAQHGGEVQLGSRGMAGVELPGLPGHLSTKPSGLAMAEATGHGMAEAGEKGQLDAMRAVSMGAAFGLSRRPVTDLASHLRAVQGTPGIQASKDDMQRVSQLSDVLGGVK